MNFFLQFLLRFSKAGETTPVQTLLVWLGLIKRKDTGCSIEFASCILNVRQPLYFRSEFSLNRFSVPFSLHRKVKFEILIAYTQAGGATEYTERRYVVRILKKKGNYSIKVTEKIAVIRLPIRLVMTGIIEQDYNFKIHTGCKNSSTISIKTDNKNKCRFISLLVMKSTARYITSWKEHPGEISL